MALMRGLDPTPRHILAAATPHRAVKAAPAFLLWEWTYLSMWLNDQFGCCVTAAQAFMKALKTVGGFTAITDATVQSWAQAHGVLNGANITQVYGWMQKDGFQQDNARWEDGPYNSVNYANRAAFCAAIADGPVGVGIAADQLYTTCVSYGEGVSGWLATGYTKARMADHKAVVLGYGTSAQIYPLILAISQTLG